MAVVTEGGEGEAVRGTVSGEGSRVGWNQDMRDFPRGGIYIALD